MLTKKRLFVVFLLLSATVLLRVYFYFSSAQTSGSINIKGQVLNEPKLNYDKLNFRVDRYLVRSDYQNISFGENVFVSGELKEGIIEASEVKQVSTGALQSWLNSLRTRLNKQIIQNFPSPQSQLLAGIVLGVKSDLSKDFKTNLIETGTLHVVVVSGYNIALVAGLALSLSFLIGRKRASLLAVVLVITYGSLVGFSPPTTRAVIMATLTIVAISLGRQALALYLLILTGLVMVLFSPENLVDISFQLTFLATIGLILFAKPISSVLNKLPKIVSEPLSTTLAAQVLVVPLIFFYFGNVSLSSPLVNVLVLWTVPISTVLGFLYLVVVQLNLFLADLISFLLLLPLTTFVFVVNGFAKLDFLSIESAAGNFVVVTGYVFIILGVTLFSLKKSYAEK